jgi:aspartate aminotransferase
MKKIQSQSTSNASSIAQAAAVAALDGDQTYIKESTGIFKERHDFVLKSLQEIDGISCLASEGTFYSFPDMNGLIEKLDEINNGTWLGIWCTRMYANIFCDQYGKS